MLTDLKNEDSMNSTDVKEEQGDQIILVRIKIILNCHQRLDACQAFFCGHFMKDLLTI